MKNQSTLMLVPLLLAVSNLSAATRYVSLTSTNPTPPYTNWVRAATNIQDAVSVATAGDEIVVTNGTYATGSPTADPYGFPNRVAVLKPLALRSVNGPRVTMIQGGQIPASTLGGPRCVYLASGASLSGFTLAGGSTGIGSFQDPSTRTGGGVLCAGLGAVLSNCVLYGNAATDSGGGAQGGTLNSCTLSGNWALGAGGGAFGGWGAYNRNCTLNNCKLTGNSAGSGGGARNATLNNCTLTGNFATSSDLSGGGANGCALYNCIVYYNMATNGPNYDSCGLHYCCTTPEPPYITEGCITNEPGFVDYAGGNLRLQPDSPCVGMGNVDFVVGSTDLDGRPRTGPGWVDLGAYQFQWQDGITGEFIGWLQNYGLPSDGSADYTDPDGDGMNNWQEWVCSTCPTNSLSALRLLSARPQGTNLTVTWQSVSGVNYFLKRSTNVASPSQFVATNMVGQEGTTTSTDTNATGAGPLFYRVGVGN